MVKVTGKKEEVDKFVNFIESYIDRTIEELCYHNCRTTRDDYIKYDIEYVDSTDYISFNSELKQFYTKMYNDSYVLRNRLDIQLSELKELIEGL